MKVYRPLLAAFAEDAGTDPATKAAETAIGAALGDDRKKGWSKDRQKICRDIYAANKAPIHESLTGDLVDVGLATTSDGRNEYHKVRMTLRNESGDRVIVSLDRDTELTQRLLCKLLAVEPGTRVTLGAFVEPVERKGRTFVNHVPTLKVNGKEVSATPGHFAAAAEKGKAAESALAAAGLGGNKELVAKARAGAKVEYFAGLSEQVAAKFASDDAGSSQPTVTEDW